MKIGILTMDYKKNYGGILQCYGLYKYLMSEGHDVKVIDFKNTGKRSLINYLSKIKDIKAHLPKKKAVNTNNTKPLSKRYLQNFVDFRNDYLQYTEPVNENGLSRLCVQFDAVVVGSDQIWNDINTHKLAYYFDWKYDGLKIAYAPCTIFSKAPLLLRSKIKGLLSRFDLLTARDSNTAQYVESFGLASPDIVVDPSCLYDYRDLLGGNPIGEPYILTYILGSEINGGNKEVIKHIKKLVGDIRVVSVCIPSVSTVCENISDAVYYDASPIDWVNLFYHASFVFTDSFHGCMFSMKFQKPFIAYYKESSRQSRMLDLIQRFELKNIIVNSAAVGEFKTLESLVNYSTLNEKLSDAINKSTELLHQSIR
ncbi:MAG: polysaccharide pyruvyl transferase family protein [Muribaculaceae bacterium]|nr:polysaccharide pyruvyl transferase family protein [Muribaculaceae bacterium]